MADNNLVKFYHGNEERLPTQAERDSDGFYVTDDSGKLFVGERQITDIDASVVTADTAVKYDATKGKLVESTLKLTANNSLIIDKGVATGSNAIVGGTNDKSVISNILGNLASAAVSVEAPKSSANATISIGSGTNTISTGSNAIGVMNTTGVKGYYYTNINFSTKEITLSTSRSSSSGSNLATKFKDGDAISFVNDAKFPFCCKVVGSQTSGNVITVDSLPFSSADNIVTYSAISDLAQQYLPDDFTIFACYEDTIISDRKRWLPREGIIELGWAGTALGVMNLTTGSGAFVTGYNNWAAGDFGAVFGRDNVGGYANITAGYGNTNTGNQSIVTGNGNKLYRATNTAMFGRLNEADENADASIIAGSSHVASAYATVLLGSSNKVTKQYGAAIGVALTVNKEAQVAVGRYNDPNTEARFVVGIGTGRDGKEKNGFEVFDDGTIKVNKNIILGTENTMDNSKQYTIISGSECLGDGSYSMITGKGCRSGALYGIAANYKTNARYKASSAFGYGTVTDSAGQFVVGKANKAVPASLFVVGNGKDNNGTDIAGDQVDYVFDDFRNPDSSYRSNAFVVYEDGRAQIGADPIYGNDVVNKEYHDKHAGALTSKLTVNKNYGDKQDGYYSATVGPDEANAISREFNFAVGYDNMIDGPVNLVAGTSNIVSSGKWHSLAIGKSNQIKESFGAAIGVNNVIKTGGTYAVGLHNITNYKTGQFVVGRGNKVENEAMFIVGNSSAVNSTNVESITDAQRSNAFVVWSDGRATAGKDPTDAMDLVTKQYLENNGAGLPSIPEGTPDGAILVVRNGQWVIENPPTTVYTGEVV